MFPKKFHSPAQPKDSNPPPSLVALVDQHKFPLPVIRSGLTATSQGEWALLVSVPSSTVVPIPELETAAHGFPVIYVEEPDKPILAQ